MGPGSGAALPTWHDLLLEVCPFQRSEERLVRHRRIFPQHLVGTDLPTFRCVPGFLLGGEFDAVLAFEFGKIVDQLRGQACVGWQPITVVAMPWKKMQPEIERRWPDCRQGDRGRAWPPNRSRRWLRI